MACIGQRESPLPAEVKHCIISTFASGVTCFHKRHTIWNMWTHVRNSDTPLITLLSVVNRRTTYGHSHQRLHFEQLAKIAPCSTISAPGKHWHCKCPGERRVNTTIMCAGLSSFFFFFTPWTSMILVLPISLLPILPYIVQIWLWVFFFMYLGDHFALWCITECKCQATAWLQVFPLFCGHISGSSKRLGPLDFLSANSWAVALLFFFSGPPTIEQPHLMAFWNFAPVFFGCRWHLPVQR